jgi:2-polyprenyl-3-methyl-5-hydroxy-6-metoxy-1,4-benzoquinol methylase
VSPPSAESWYHPDASGIQVPPQPVLHHDEEYDQAAFDLLQDMQLRHFWYQGRHRLLLRALRAELRKVGAPAGGLSAIDLGGGCGGWLTYLRQHLPGGFAELALSDSSRRALEMASPVLGEGIERYQIDLRNLLWQDRWDVAFLLDVLEHIPQDLQTLREVMAALRPGGLLFVTTPALRAFWSYNDTLAHHQRRYSRGDFARLARESGLELRQTRYFMFFLSPVLWLSRLRQPNLDKMTPEQICALARHTHRVPPPQVNGLLRLIFSAETPLGLWLPFPWGTSILGVFRKPF